MYTVFWRLFIRLIVLFLWVFSIFFFYVLGYKYDTKIGFIKSSWVYDIKYYSKDPLNEQISINWWNYYFVSNKLTLRNVRSNSCWQVKIWDFDKYNCYDDKSFSNVVYISPSSLEIRPSSVSFFPKLTLYWDYDPFLKYSFYWNGINFFYYQNWDLTYKDDVSTKKLINIKNVEFVGYENWWLYFTLDGKLHFLAINNNL